ncbi:MAG: SGNH/GDSL hydrolase family protein [Paenibacillus sp.]|nr:SGNH/GDSL hydrolase family protein [Paenibacillus sp.]
MKNFRKCFGGGRVMRWITGAVMCLILSSAGVPGAGKRILFIGDSITDGGWGRSGGSMAPSRERNLKDQNHLYGHSYMMLCAAQYESDHPGEGIVSFNRGISGNALSDLTARWEEDALALHPDVISILVGTNDVDRQLRENGDKDFDFATWDRAYRDLLDRALKANPSTRFILGAPFVAKAGKVGKAENYERRLELVNRCAEVVRKIAEDYGAVYLPYNEMFAELTAKYDPSYWIWDGIHPTPAGHQRMADLWLSQAGIF